MHASFIAQGAFVPTVHACVHSIVSGAQIVPASQSRSLVHALPMRCEPPT